MTMDGGREGDGSSPEDCERDAHHDGIGPVSARGCGHDGAAWPAVFDCQHRLVEAHIEPGGQMVDQGSVAADDHIVSARVKSIGGRPLERDAVGRAPDVQSGLVPCDPESGHIGGRTLQPPVRCVPVGRRLVSGLADRLEGLHGIEVEPCRRRGRGDRGRRPAATLHEHRRTRAPHSVVAGAQPGCPHRIAEWVSVWPVDPGGTEIHGRTGQVEGVGPAADPVPRLEHRHIDVAVGEQTGGG